MSEFSRLTKREHDVLLLIVKGHRDKDITKHLAISVSTVHKHVRSILRRLEVSNRTEAANVYWRQHTTKYG